MKAYAVIGALFGDEGKGKTVHCLSLTSDPKTTIVVRYNGGAQAGHTVVDDKKKLHHIFHHFGSGTLNGNPTYLAYPFIVNPLIWMPECADLEGMLGFVPKLYIDPMCLVTTPYDMLINREVETNRGDNKHGSCGYGINETTERNIKYPIYRFLYKDITKNPREFLDRIQNEFVPRRLDELKIKPSGSFLKVWKSQELFDDFIKALDKLHRFSVPFKDIELGNFKTVIFEGAQGLCLDQNHDFFPHVTRSKTGLTNIDEICLHAGIKEVEVFYVTRAYSVRHGAGPFPTEDTGLEYEDLTNVENPWQGKLRFGHLDWDLLEKSVKDDLKRAKNIKVKIGLSLTCMDQVGDTITVYRDGDSKAVQRKKLPILLAKSIGAKKVLVHYKR